MGTVDSPSNVPYYKLMKTQMISNTKINISNNIQLIAADLDGTLLNSQKEISPLTSQILSQAIQQGIHFVPATGRAFDSVPECVRNFPGIEYIITSNGAAIYSVSKKMRIYEKLLDAKSVEEVLKIPFSDTTALEIFIDGIPYASREYVENPEKYGATDYGVKYVQATRTPVDDLYSMMQKEKHRLDSIAISFGKHEDLVSMNQILNEKIPHAFITMSVGHMLEIGHQDAGKGKTLSYLLKHLDISPEHAAAFGDADNDIDMLQLVQYGFLMENAGDDLIRQHPELSVTRNNNDEGIVHALLSV